MIVREVVVNRQSIVAYLGSSEYDSWAVETKNAKEELARYDRLRNHLPPKYLAWISMDASTDADIVEKTTNDYGWAIEQISGGKKVSQEQITKIAGIQSTALEALRIEDDVMEAITITGIFAGFLTIQWRNIEAAAQKALPMVKALEEALNKAKRTSVEARIQQVVDIGLNVLTIVQPELGVLAKVSIAAAQFGLDKLLGGEKSTPTKDDLSDYNSVSGTYGAAMEDWKFLMPLEKRAVKVAGKGIMIAGLYFDQDEVQTALKNEAEVREALNKALEYLRSVRALVERVRPNMLKLQVQLAHAAREVKIAKDSAAEIREEYKRMIDEAKYAISGPISWRYN